MSKELGLVLRTLRRNCELTQRQIAEVLHIDRSTYAYYERGTTEPDLKSILKISKMLNVDVESLLPDEEGVPSIKVSDITKETKEKIAKAKEKDGKLNADLKEPQIYMLTQEEQDLLIRFRIMQSEKQDEVMDFVKSFETKE